PRLHARVRGRAFLPRAARRSHLGRDERNPAAHHRPRPAEARPRRPVTRTTLRARSRFLIAAVFTVAVLAGCGRDATESRPGGGRNVLNIYNWSDYVAPDTIRNFEREYGIQVNYDVYDSSEIVDAK